ncbi:hypothetical protein UNDKW_4421 [Undibacterium sp. KW1]|uniref:SLOG cluster 4 domain-containing protein n=1 Tax=Undibacterium sp. KW1 TaxID=2058624 RepID=UPI001331CA1F|nr:hypothetical protein [Undibacterium sp. KW1]BBB62694.1 hypothetical protein UNDKW_4421 [Undibacterium sp. KW1]
MQTETDQTLQTLLHILPPGPRIAIIGSTAFWHPDSEQTCQLLGQALASIPGLVLLTGGVSGIGEACGRSFYQRRQQLQMPPQVFHILPQGMAAWDYGQTLHAGKDMQERRAVLARMAPVYIVIEGGPATADEVQIALSNGALVIPIARSGACARDAYAQISKLARVDTGLWAVLGDAAASVEQTVAAVMAVVAGFLQLQAS